MNHTGTQEDLKKAMDEILRNSFKPEFLNRIDESIIFEALSKEHLAEIVKLQTDYLDRRLAAKDIGLEITDEAEHLIAKTGYDPRFGARPLKRQIQKLIENPLAEYIISGRILPKHTVKVDADNDEIVFTVS
jgi:ATP-dependent Clp protease ATP-binding subunit ClpB